MKENTTHKEVDETIEKVIVTYCNDQKVVYDALRWSVVGEAVSKICKSFKIVRIVTDEVLIYKYIAFNEWVYKRSKEDEIIFLKKIKNSCGFAFYRLKFRFKEWINSLF